MTTRCYMTIRERRFGQRCMFAPLVERAYRHHNYGAIAVFEIEVTRPDGRASSEEVIAMRPRCEVCGGGLQAELCGPKCAKALQGQRLGPGPKEHGIDFKYNHATRGLQDSCTCSATTSCCVVIVRGRVVTNSRRFGGGHLDQNGVGVLEYGFDQHRTDDGQLGSAAIL